MSELPRKDRLDLNTPAELAIRNAVIEVERLKSHPTLTDVVKLLNIARETLAKHIDELNNNKS